MRPIGAAVLWGDRGACRRHCAPCSSPHVSVHSSQTC